VNLDLEFLLKPITPERPEGASLVYDPLYDRIREARRADDPTLPVGVWERDLEKADWAETAALCIEGLGTRSKDLQLAVWLLEALIHLDGFSGLARGLGFLVALTERYGDSFYPKVVDGDAEHRDSLFAWMNRHLLIPIKTVPISSPDDQETPVFNFLQWETALRHTAGAPADREEAISIVMVNTSLKRTPTTLLRALVRDLDTARDFLDRLQQRLDAEEGSETPSLQPLIDCVSQIREKIMKNADERGPDKASEGRPLEKDPVGRQSAAEAPDLPARRLIEGREDAYRQLEEIADFLLKTEPHSPTPYLLKRIASWGDMTLFDLLREVASADDEQNRLQELFFLKDREG